MRNALIFTLSILACAFAVASPGTIGIVAVVDDQVISSVDLDDRVGLVIGTTGIPDTQENRQRLAPQILRQLIDEKLKMEEAGRDGVTVSDTKLHEAIAQIEAQGNRPVGSLEQYLESKGLSKQSFYTQVRAQIAWADIVTKKIRPKIHISDQEVARYVKRKSESPATAQEVMIAVIRLPVDTPQNAAGVKALADKLSGEIRAGASFDAIASQFSSGTGGTKASEPFWVELPQLDPAIGTALSKTEKGAITDPIHTGNGYEIIKYIDTRQAQSSEPKEVAEEPKAELAYKDIVMTLKPDAPQKDPATLLQIAHGVTQAPGGCGEKSMTGAGDLALFNFQVTLPRVVSTDLPQKERELLMSLKVGKASEPIVTPQGIHVLMLCERMDMPPAKVPASIAENAIRQSIYKEKLELEAQKYMRDIRREAFVEIRLH